MTNTQLWIAVGLPIIAILTSLIISLVQISGMRDDIREMRSDMKLILGALNA